MAEHFEGAHDSAGALTFRCAQGRAATTAHGFSGRGILDKKVSVEEARGILADYFEIPEVLLPVQTHGDHIIEIAGAAPALQCEGDALLIEIPRDRPIVACIRTADCVPLLVFGKTKVALIHAGWRGLANSIIEKTIAKFEHQDEPLQVLIGPCAGAEKYEVGKEVIDAIGQNAVVNKTPDAPLLLDLSGTARRILAKMEMKSVIFAADICTISDARFHSHRRDGDQAGRNISFIRL